MTKKLTIISLYLLALTCTQIPTVISAAASSPQTIAANSVAPETIARQITVRVLVGDRRSSGTIIARQGNRYTILTNAHVTNKGNSYRITAPDGKTYPAKCAQPLKQGVCTTDKNNDLALLEFTSSQTYTVPAWGDTRSLTPGETIYSAGFPFDKQALQVTTGKIDTQTSKPLQGGYQIGFGSTTEPGMSGGSLLNSQGQLIGIIGFSSYPILNDGYQYQDGSQPAAGEIRELRKSSFAIPIATLAIIDRQYAALLPKNGGGTTTTIAKTKYTGVVKTVDDIAQQITVRIEDKNGGNGSGVIVAKEGDTYCVATAAHVIQEIRDDRQKIAIAVVTPTQERIVLSSGDINVVNRDLDIGIVKFKSTQNYQIANLSKYEFRKNDWAFLSGFPGQDDNKKRLLTIGKVWRKEATEFAVTYRNKDKDKGIELGSLKNGNSLIYTNLSLPGMSGGGVLDRQGRLIGINTGAENERLLLNDKIEDINFGYAFGVPVSILLGITTKRQISNAQLQVKDTPVYESSQSENEEIQRNQLSILQKPSLTSSIGEWLDYAHLLRRGDKDREAIAAYEMAIKLLQRNPETPDRQVKLRIAYFSLGMIARAKGTTHELAVKNFRLATKVDPSFYPSSNYLGYLLFELKRYDEALIAYQTAIDSKEGQNDFSSYMQKSLVLFDLKRYPEAIDTINRSISLQPNNFAIYNIRGMYYMMQWAEYSVQHGEEQQKFSSITQQKLSQALADFNKSIQLNPQYISSYTGRGMVYYSQGKYQQGLADLTQAIELDPKDVDKYIIRGSVYTLQEKYSQALTDLTQAIKLDPKNIKAYNNRGDVYRRQQQYPQALADLNKAIQLDSQDRSSYYYRGVVYDELKQYSQALTDLNKAIQIDPKDRSSYAYRATIYRTQKQYPKALADLSKVIELNPQKADIYKFRGSTYVEQKQYSLAIADYTKAIKIDPQDEEAFYERGNIYNQQQQYLPAIADYTQVIKIKPQSVDAYYRRGGIYNQQQQYLLAIADYTQVIRIKPQFADTYYHRGRIYQEQQKYDLAIVDYAQVIKINPQMAEAYYYRANIYGQQQKYKQAIVDYTQVLKINPQSAEAYYSRGGMHQLQDQYAKAIEDYTQAIKIEPKNDAIYNYRGFSYYKWKKHDQAIADFNKAVKINPKFADAYNNLANVYNDKKQYDQAITNYTQVIKLSPQSAETYFYRGNIYNQQQKYDRAIADYTEAVKINPQLSEAYYNRGRIYHDGQKRYDQAITDYTQVIKIKPSFAEAYFYRGNIYSQQQKYDQAITDYTQVIKIKPQSAEVYFYRGNIYSQQQKYEEAIADYTQVIKFNPQSAETYNNLGRVYLDQKKYDSALVQFDQAIKINPKFVEAYFQRGNIYLGRKKYDLALAQYEQAIKINPKFVEAYNNRGFIYYEIGNIHEAMQNWREAILIDSKLAEPTLALAVALFNQGQQSESFIMAEKAIRLDRNFTNIQYLKDNLWGEKVVADTQKLLDTPRMKEFISKNGH